MSDVTYTEVEIASQPECWRRAAAAAVDAAPSLPRIGERVAVVGCGTSLFMAQAYASLRERAGHGETDAFAASEFPYVRRYARVLALTRSGTTTEVLELLGRLSGSVPTTVIVADPWRPVADLADEVVSLEFADEKSVVQTRFATSALILLRAHLDPHFDVGRAVAEAQRAVAEPLPDAILDGKQFTFLGRGWTVALASEAALKMCEATLSWTSAYAAMEYRHGPISIAAPGTVTWMIGDAPPGLGDQVTRTGGRWIDACTDGRDPLAELIRVQRLAVALGAAKGLDVDRPRNLTRSVVLAEP